MSKYIIDTDQFEKLFETKAVAVLGIGDNLAVPEEGEKTVWTRMLNVADLEELTSNYINKHFSDPQDTAYQRGQIELIVAIRELIKHDNSNDWKEMGFEFDSIAWSYRLTEILGNYEPSEIIKRVKACEQKQTKRNIESDLDYLMQSTGMTIKEIAAELKERVE